MNDYQIIEKWVDFLREKGVTTPASLDLSTIRYSWARVDKGDYKSNKEQRQLYLELLEDLLKGYCQIDKYPSDWVNNPRFKELIKQTGATDSNQNWVFKEWVLSQLGGVEESHIDSLDATVVASLSNRFREIRAHDSEALQISSNAYQHLKEKESKIDQGRSINEKNPSLAGYENRKKQLDKYENEILKNHRNRYLEIESYRAQVESTWKDNCVNAIVKSLIDLEVLHHLPQLEELSQLISRLPEIEESHDWDESALCEAWKQTFPPIAEQALGKGYVLEFEQKSSPGPPRATYIQANFNAPGSKSLNQQLN